MLRLAELALSTGCPMYHIGGRELRICIMTLLRLDALLVLAATHSYVCFSISVSGFWRSMANGKMVGGSCGANVVEECTQAVGCDGGACLCRYYLDQIGHGIPGI
jgi:hypothetical protein